MVKPSEFIVNYSKAGAAKCESGSLRLLLLAVLSGFILACAGAAASTASCAVENASVAKLISGSLFPFGLIAIIYSGAELFTGNCLVSITVLQGEAKLSAMVRNLVLVYIGNFVGCAMVAAGYMLCGAKNGVLAVSAIRIAVNKCSLDFFKAVVLGVLCNVLVCLGVVCAVSAKTASGKAVGAFLPVCLFVICGFEHSIANMYYIPAGLFANMLPDYAALAAGAGIDTAALTWANFAVKNLIPVTIGNILGGVGLGSLLWVCNRPNT